jgi:hypothetical protein
VTDYIDLLQWPAMVVTLMGAWWLASQKPGRRMIGFLLMVTSNVLWMIWGWSDEAWALVVLQVCLMATNVRGIVKNEHQAHADGARNPVN